MNLYQLPQEAEKALERYLACFDPETGELLTTEEDLKQAQAELSESENRTNEAIEWALQKRANALARVAGVKSEIERLSGVSKREEKTAEKMEDIIRHFLPEIEKKVTVGNWDISYTKSQGTIVTDLAKLPESLQKKTLVPSFDLMEIRDVFDVQGLEYTINTEHAQLKEVKAWLEGLSEEEAKKMEGVANIENRKKLKIK